MDLSTIISAVEGAVRLAVDAPVLAFGFVAGAVTYGFLLKRYPTLAASLVAKATTEVQTLVQTELTKAATANAAAANAAATTKSVTGSK